MANLPTKHTLQKTTPIGGTAVDAELKSCLEQQSSVFESAVALIERLEHAAGKRELGHPDSVVQLQKSLDEVVAAQQKVSAARIRFHESKASLSNDVRQAIARHEGLLSNLITRIDQLQATFAGIQAELMPQLDSETRRRNMQTAYQKSLRSV